MDWLFLSLGRLIDEAVDMLCWMWDKENLFKGSFKVNDLWIYTSNDSV